MSSFVQSDFQIRPEDKECNFFTQSLDDPFDDIFNQYVNLDTSDSNDFFNDSTQPNLCGEVDFAFDADTASNGRSYTLGPPPPSIIPAISDPPHEAGRAHKQWPALDRVNSPYHSRVDRAQSIRADNPGPLLLTLESKSDLQASAFTDPTSPPFTPPYSPLRRVAHPTTPSSKNTIRHRDRISKTPHRINNASPRMMSPSYYHRQETPSFQEWTQRFEQFNLQSMATSSALSPPPPARVSQQENPARSWEPQRNSLFEYPDPPELGDDAMVALYKHRTTNVGPGHGSSSPTLVNREKHVRRHARMSSSKEVYSSPVAAPQPHRSVSWMQSTVTPSEFEYTPPLDAWTGTVQIQHQQQLRQQPQQIEQQPWYDTAQLPENHASQTFQNMDFATQGLMIQCGDPFGPYVAEDSSDDYLTSNPYQANIAAEVFPSDLSSDTNPPQCQRTPSLSSSPSPPMPKSRRSSKSAKHRRRKCSTSPTTPKTPSTAAGFVNYTPNDSKRILTGVAPSGSSKTKARREKEAMERSRRLSQAALRAVQKAGGDLEMLRDEGAWDL
ncbi:developmental regulatory protein [Lasallia pustulata]|uniref:Developmental regulatory protein n=1 Tax=Lasallia pustulata TaxID=136370 RepID=A0A1W5CRU5_9LECA|nr:developmental regulatory protein [Lasallia pustulata]